MASLLTSPPRIANLLDMEQIDNVWIPLADGTRLGARIWMPDGAERSPVPAILEYLPYRKSDATAVADGVRHPYFAASNSRTLLLRMS